MSKRRGLVSDIVELHELGEIVKLLKKEDKKEEKKDEKKPKLSPLTIWAILLVSYPIIGPLYWGIGQLAASFMARTFQH